MVSGIIHGSVQAANDKQVYCGSLAIRLMAVTRPRGRLWPISWPGGRLLLKILNNERSRRGTGTAEQRCHFRPTCGLSLFAKLMHVVLLRLHFVGLCKSRLKKKPTESIDLRTRTSQMVLNATSARDDLSGAPVLEQNFSCHRPVAVLLPGWSFHTDHSEYSHHRQSGHGDVAATFQ